MNKHIALLSILTFMILSLAVEDVRGGGGPPNDTFANALPLVLANGSVSINATNVDATKELGEADHAENGGGSSVWFTFTPTTTQILRIKTTNPSTTFDTTLAVYTGDSPASLVSVGYNDDCLANGCGTTSMVDLTLTAGTTYRIAVDGYNGATGSFVLSLTQIVTPLTYDDMETAYNLGTLDGGSIAGTNTLATAQPGEPGSFPSSAVEKSVWYRFQVSTKRAMTAELRFGFHGEAAVYVSPVANPTFSQLTRLDAHCFNFAHNYDKYILEFPAGPNAYYFVQVDFYEAFAANPKPTGNFQLKLYRSKLRYGTRLANFTRQTAVSVFRTSDAKWYERRSINEPAGVYTNFGSSTDVQVPADFDGDGLTNYAVTRNEGGVKRWYVLNQWSASAFSSFPWGLPTDKELVGDFDRDGMADAVAIRTVNGTLVWYVRQSSNTAMRVFTWGAGTDRPVIGDFDGDGATDVAVVRATASGLVWYILRSNGSQAYVDSIAHTFGAADDIPAVEDFDGDGRSDIAVFRPSNGTWYVLRSTSGQLHVMAFGSAGDVPQPGDYDGDGTADRAVFRPSTGVWHFWLSSTSSHAQVAWGKPGDIPLSSMSRFSLPEPNE